MRSRVLAPWILGLALLLNGCEGNSVAGTPAEELAATPLPRAPVFITNGFVDAANAFGNVGAFIVQRPSDGQIFPVCSGTLIAPTVFLTAGHCTQFYLDELVPLGFGVFVSFSSPIGFGDMTDLGSITLISVTDVVTNPAFSPRQDNPGDLGVLILPGGSTAGITPATLPTAGLLDQLMAQKALRNATFTAVGYGVQDVVVGEGPPFFQDMNPIPRMFAFSSFSALSPGYLRLSQNTATGDGGTCLGDSGGPNFLTVNSQQILAANTVTGDEWCRATNVVYRLDTAVARDFLGDFVDLP